MQSHRTAWWCKQSTIAALRFKAEYSVTDRLCILTVQRQDDFTCRLWSLHHEHALWHRRDMMDLVMSCVCTVGKPQVWGRSDTTAW